MGDAGPSRDGVEGADFWARIRMSIPLYEVARKRRDLLTDTRHVLH